MKVQVGSRIKSLVVFPGAEGETGLDVGSVLTIAELGYFGVGQHLAIDSRSNPWVIDEGTIDARNPDHNDFTLMKEQDA